MLQQVRRTLRKAPSDDPGINLRRLAGNDRIEGSHCADAASVNLLLRVDAVYLPAAVFSENFNHSCEAAAAVSRFAAMVFSRRLASPRVSAAIRALGVLAPALGGVLSCLTLLAHVQVENLDFGL